MIRYVTYKNKINNIDQKRLPNFSSNSSQNNQRLKKGWRKDVKSRLNHFGIQEEATMLNISNITNTITSKFKENMWWDKELVVKRKLIYYKEVVNPNLEDQNDLFLLRIANKKINIAKIITNYH
jgi:hypothetical protein